VIRCISNLLYTYTEWVEIGQTKKERKFVLIMGHMYVVVLHFWMIT
jgi:hypothetical protein